MLGSTFTREKPLLGIRVLDFTHAAAGPFATMFLGDMGADVIKIEKPKMGDGTRSMGRPMPMLGRKESDYYVALNRNKKGMVLDLTKPDGAELARRLVEKSDIVVQNFRPQVMERLGLGFEELQKIRPGLIYCSISAFGTTGPWAGRPANDIIMQSVSGLMGITGEVGGGPVRIGAPISDFSTGLFALSGILAALHGRHRHPEGQHVHITMLEASLNMMSSFIPSVAMLDHKIQRLGRAHDQIVPYQAFLCADGEYIMVGAFTKAFWQNLCRALGREDWITDPLFVSNHRRLENRSVLVPQLEKIFKTKSSAQWMSVLDQVDVPNSPVFELHDAIRSEQAAHNGSVRWIGRGNSAIKVVRSPIQTPQWGDNEQDSPAPLLGQHTEQILHELLGLEEAEIANLVEREAIGIQKRAIAGEQS